MSIRVLKMKIGLPSGAAAASEGDDQGGVCIANIDTIGRRLRLMAGVILLVVGLGLLAILLAQHANPWWRLPLLLVFWGAAVSYYQWRDHT